MLFFVLIIATLNLLIAFTKATKVLDKMSSKVSAELYNSLLCIPCFGTDRVLQQIALKLF